MSRKGNQHGQSCQNPGFLPDQDDGQFQSWSTSSLYLSILARTLRSKVSFVHFDWGGTEKESGLACAFGTPQMSTLCLVRNIQ